ncbi:SDR family NAD(P)-dependent oxidoreductase [Bradyrhizobium sp. Ce-3]|uniref:SDR family NAD(P)-dependent oxidoreductase n=1 Tax=Bradyrhizobium sp. Ce-3 TaxID=2913970 RepID=UPI001FBA6AEA|nr:SDR family NAD(P)-dependent oxidoreductase [Bradyrhizobium sp. Ce-3]GKQ50193.1 short-chain dehydrogenase/reductase [Bradyrhizobium sp. Ce-3]
MMQANSNAGWTLVTGATGGLGGALVARLLADGRRVIATARRPELLDAHQGSGLLRTLSLDLSDPAAIADARNSVAEIVKGDRLSGLVNMAGIIVEGPLEAVPVSELRRQLDVNVIGPFALAQALLPLLKGSRGTIVNIGAISAHITIPFYGPIAASKAGLAALNDAMRLEFGPYGIKVFLIEPGAMKTGIFSTSRAARDATLAKSPELDQRYRPALAAMDRSFEKSGADDPAVVVNAVMAALAGGKVKPRMVVGKGTRALMLLSHLPDRLRDRLVKNALGLGSALKSTT